jgi:endoglucanase
MMKRRAMALILASLVVVPGAVRAGEKWEFWSEQKKGANGFNAKFTEEWFEAAADLGLEFVRLVPDWWKPADKYFLIGDDDNYKGINETDYAELKRVLGWAAKHRIKIVLSMASLPGLLMRQFNGHKFDYRLWGDEKYHLQAFAFWSELARRLKDHPAIYGYNPLNEPHGERHDGFEGGRMKGFAEWYEKKKGGTWDLNRFNRRMVEAIRKEDQETPIVLDGWFHAGPEGFKFLEPVDDPFTIYAFHFYDPWEFATYRVNKGRFAYPDRMPAEDGGTEHWTAADLAKKMKPILGWMKRNRMPPTRVMVGEFGCDRRVGGVIKFMTDAIALWNEHGWHWAFYAYREDKWNAMDYELGTGAIGGNYWTAVERGEKPEPPRRDNPLFDVIKREFKREGENQ